MQEERFAANQEISAECEGLKISGLPNRGAMDGKLPRSE